MKKEYKIVEIEVISFSNEDVITTSCPTETENF